MSAQSGATAPALQSLLCPDDNHVAPSLAEVRSLAQRCLGKFSRHAMSLVGAHGISLPPALDLFGTSEGNMAIHGAHPDADLIDAVLCCDIQAAQYFKEAEVLFETVRTLETSSACAPRQDNERFHIGLTTTGPVAYFTTGA